MIKMKFFKEIKYPFILGSLITFLFILIGIGIIFKGMYLWILIICFSLLFLLLLPLEWWIVLSISSATFVRIFTHYKILPGFINFIHFPLVLGTTFVALFYKNTSLSFKLGIGLLNLGIIVILSWVINGGEWLRPLLAYMLLAEPFLVLYAISKSSQKKMENILKFLAFFVPVVQIPIVVYQAIFIGLADHVQGTFAGQGAGHHVLGAISLLGVLYMFSYIFYKFDYRKLIIAALLFLIPILSDAKQCIIAFIPAITLMTIYTFKYDIKKFFFIGILSSLFLFLAFFYYKPLRLVFNTNLISKGLALKISLTKIVFNKLFKDPVYILIGLGPGNSVSRAALLAKKGYIRSLPKNFINLKLSKTTLEVLKESGIEWNTETLSSVWTGVASLLGVIGDFGILGFLAYMYFFVIIWLSVNKKNFEWVTKGALIMALFLGSVFSWLETPEFTLPWTIFVALGLINEHSDRS